MFFQTPSRHSAPDQVVEDGDFVSGNLWNKMKLLLLISAEQNGLVVAKTLVFPMLAPSSSLKLPSTCTAGEKTLLSPLSSNSTDKTDSLNVKVPTSTKFNLGNTTPELLIPVSMFTRSLLDQKNTNHREPATCRESTTQLFNLFFRTQPFLAPTPRR